MTAPTVATHWPVPEVKLRPTRLADIVGQAEAIEQVSRAVDAALHDGRMPGHMLLMGPPGTGKTTIAQAIANALGGRLVELFGVSLRYPRDITVPLVFSRPRDVVMIDEVHRVSRPVQEILYTVMEDGKLSSSSRWSTSMLDLPPLMVVGATTDPGRLTEPMLDRFRLKVKLSLYDVADLVVVAQRAAAALGVGLTDAAAQMIAERGQGTPRIVINLVWAARDWALVVNGSMLSFAQVSAHAADDPYWFDGHGTWSERDAWAGTAAEYAQLAEYAVVGARWVTTASVREVADSPALVWQVEGRDAG